jgi:hypothetical protein
MAMEGVESKAFRRKPASRGLFVVVATMVLDNRASLLESALESVSPQ